MINKNYRDSALEKYGHQCELCGHTMVEVHHIDYQEHQQFEDLLRHQLKYDAMEFSRTMEKAKQAGYDIFDSGSRQLSKNDDTKNLSVLCANCHGLCHLIDYGKKLLKALKQRR